MDMITPRDYRTRGEGVAFHGGKLSRREMRVIEELGQLNDLRRRYLGMRSRAGLWRVAKQYERRGMLRMAEEVRAEARHI